MTYDILVDWCHKKFAMNKKNVLIDCELMVFGQKWKVTTKKEKLTTALESEINSYKLISKSFQRSHFPDL